MTAERRFRIAAAVYLVYGVVYLAGAVYLQSRGIGTRGTGGGTGGWLWFAMGALFLLLFPWLISRGTRGLVYLWFVRLLAALVLWRAVGLTGIAVAPRLEQIPLPGGSVLSTRLGALLFLGVTLANAATLIWASWRSTRWPSSA